MMKRQKQTYEFWRDEARYIAGVNPIQPGPNFNRDPKCFAEYCAMQAQGAKDDGYPLLAMDIKQAMYIALYRPSGPKRWVAVPDGIW